MHLNHLEHFGTYLHGPIQKDEALFLYAVCKMIRPKVILEFGIQNGFSSWNFALAKDDDCFLFSFDIDPVCVKIATERLAGIPNCFLTAKDCRQFEATDVMNRKVDVCLLDCAHQLEINKECVRRFMPCMSDTGIVAIHDTGAWSKASYEAAPTEYKNTPQGQGLGKHFATRSFVPAVLAERLTVNWMLEEYPQYAQLHFHSSTYFRHGITLMQKKQSLEV